VACFEVQGNPIGKPKKPCQVALNKMCILILTEDFKERFQELEDDLNFDNLSAVAF